MVGPGRRRTHRAGSISYRVEPGVVAFIPGGTFHRLRNDGDDELILLTIWPQPVAPDGNGSTHNDLRAGAQGFFYAMVDI